MALPICKVIDISLELDDSKFKMRTPPGFKKDMQFEVEVIKGYEDGGYNQIVRGAHMRLHAGTHVDAPSHMIKGAPDLQDVPRPPGSRRLMSAAEQGEPEAAVMYGGSSMTSWELEGYYTRELPAHGQVEPRRPLARRHDPPAFPRRLRHQHRDRPHHGQLQGRPAEQIRQKGEQGQAHDGGHEDFGHLIDQALYRRLGRPRRRPRALADIGATDGAGARLRARAAGRLRWGRRPGSAPFPQPTLEGIAVKGLANLKKAFKK